MVTFLIILILWVGLGLTAGILADQKDGSDTTLKDLLAYGGFGLITVVIAIHVSVDWDKPIIKNKKVSDVEIKEKK